MSFLVLGRLVGWKKKKQKKFTRNLRIGGLKHQHYYRGAWKQQNTVTKLTQTQYGGKYDGRFHSKKGKKQKPKPFMPENADIMLIFQSKKIN